MKFQYVEKLPSTSKNLLFSSNFQCRNKPETISNLYIMRLDKNLRAVVIHLCILESLQDSGNKCKKNLKTEKKCLKIFDFSKTNVL